MLKSWQRWAYFSQWTIAAGAAVQCWQSPHWLHLPSTNGWMVVFCFSSTLLLYLFHFRFYVKKKPANDRQLFFQQHRSFLMLQFAIAALALAFSFFQMGVHFIVPIAALALCAGAYTYFILKPRHNGIFRYNGLFKILTLTVVWTAVTSVLPIAVAGKNIFELPYLYFYFIRWLFMLAICLPFDIRDMQQDGRSGYLTIPVLIGKNNTFLLSYACLFFHAALPLGGVALGFIDKNFALANIPATLLTGWCVWYSSRHLKDDFSWFLLDSNFVLRAAILGSALFI